jgi:nucleotide-binding universal stress UspA family protein
MRKEEETRIARETIDQRGFLPRLERLLLAVDESAVGRVAARLAGFIAGAQGMPVTMLKLEAGGELQPPDKSKDKASGHTQQMGSKDDAAKQSSGAQSVTESAAELEADRLAREVKAGAKRSAAKVIADEAEPDPEKVHLTARVPIDEPADVVKDEARKGYDLMFIGLDHTVEQDGGFTPRISRLAAGFDGPLMLLTNAGDAPLSSKSRLLVPVNGSAQSRRAAEIAFALARATGAKVQTLFVSQTDGRARTRLREESVLKDMVEMGERYDVAVTTRISQRSAPAGAIIQAAKGNFSMIVMGVSARPGEELFFGNTATAVLKGWDGPILMLAS